MSKRYLRRLVEDGMLSTAGMTRACPLWSACAAAAIPPNAIKDFLSRVGVAKSRFHGGWQPAGALRARGPERHCYRAPWPSLDPLKVTIDQLARGREWTCWRWKTIPIIPKWARAWCTFGRELLHRARGLHGGAGQEVLPPGSRQGSASEGRVHHQVRIEL